MHSKNGITTPTNHLTIYVVKYSFDAFYFAMKAEQTMKTVLITGGNTGIGLATAEALAAQGHRVVLACRDMGKAEQAQQKILAKTPGADVRLYKLDLASFDSIRSFSAAFLKDFPSFDVLITNAGVVPRTQQFTQEGFELQFGVNYLGHYLLTHLLLPGMANVAEARIVHLSSIMHHFGKIDFSSFKGEKKYSEIGAYGQSKLANLMFSNELAKRLPANISSNAVHPGGVDSDIYRELPKLLHQFLRLFLISTARAGKYVANMAVGEDWKGRTGEFKSAHGPLPIAKRSKDAEILEKLYTTSAQLCGVDALPAGR